MLKFFLGLFATFFVCSPSIAAPPLDMKAAEIITIKDCSTQRETRPCKGRDAIFFVHGVFGGVNSFTNGTYQWPQKLALAFPELDVFVIKYDTQLINWLNAKMATFDEISEVLMSRMQGELVGNGAARLTDGFIEARGYRSVGFIAHSLGGNVTAAYLHSVKSELGHIARAKHAFIITLGTPADGAAIANVGQIINKYLGRSDPLLKSLEKENLFLRMLAVWRRAETGKGNRFGCRPVNLYVAIEGASTLGVQVVSEQSAKAPYLNFATTKVFKDYNHLRIAAPNSEDDPLNQWVKTIINEEKTRLDKWDLDHKDRPERQKLCDSES